MDRQNSSLVPQDDWYAIIDLVTQSVDSPHSKRAYSRALNKDGRLAGSVRTKGGRRTDGYLSPQAIYNVVKEHVLAAGYINRKGDAALAAHDLRRTAAALALKGGADLRQIQQMLGHASITTTERYLEPMRSLQVTAGDYIQIELAVV